MRVAPIGVALSDPFEPANGAAAITHGHPSGWLAAGALAVMIQRLLKGAERDRAVFAGLKAAEDHIDGGEVVDALQQALDLAADDGSPSAERVEELGEGWVAEEALAIAVYALLATDDFESGIILAANHSGDSDSTASIAGQLWGARMGDEGIPPRWLDPLELRDEITHLTNRLAEAYIGAEPPTWMYSPLPPFAENRVRLVNESFARHIGYTYEDSLRLFNMDRRYEHELEVWEAMAAAFVHTLNRHALGEEDRQRLAKQLLALSFGKTLTEDSMGPPEREATRLFSEMMTALDGKQR